MEITAQELRDDPERYRGRILTVLGLDDRSGTYVPTVTGTFVGLAVGRIGPGMEGSVTGYREGLSTWHYDFEDTPKDTGFLGVFWSPEDRIVVD